MRTFFVSWHHGYGYGCGAMVAEHLTRDAVARFTRTATEIVRAETGSAPKTVTILSIVEMDA